MADSDNDSGGKSTPRGGGGSGHELSSPREQERFLPIANVSRIMKKALPANAKISKDAKETVQECVSEFISFVTGEAADKCQREKRKTINGDDLLWAMTTLGFEDYIEPLKLYLQRYRELEGDKMVSGKERDRDHAGAGVVGGFGVVCGGNVVNTGANGGVYGSPVVMLGQPVGPGQGQVHSRGPGGMYSQVRGEVVDTILAHSSVNGRSI